MAAANRVASSPTVANEEAKPPASPTHFFFASKPLNLRLTVYLISFPHSLIFLLRQFRCAWIICRIPEPPCIPILTFSHSHIFLRNHLPCIKPSTKSQSIRAFHPPISSAYRWHSGAEWHGKPGQSRGFGRHRKRLFAGRNEFR